MFFTIKFNVIFDIIRNISPTIIVNNTKNKYSVNIV